MRLAMAGLDYTTADMEIREAFSPGVPEQLRLLQGMIGEDVAGCVLIATCNRTELYVSYLGDVAPDCVDMLCRGLGRDTKRYRRHFAARYERQAVEHLMRVAAGMLSSVPGDDQIISQVRAAAETARDAETADPLLEALFRAAVTAGKKVKARVSFARDGSSVARSAVEETERRLGVLSGKRALVIGNGTIGILAASALIEKGCSVSMTLRDPRRRVDFPVGCLAVDYADRHGALAGCDVVVSATSSPGYTLLARDIEGIASLPGLFVDLAVPRDIEPAVGEMPNLTLLNVDDLRGDGAGSPDRRLAEADDIVLDEAERFELWCRNRRRYARAASGAPDFPIFINLHGVPVLIAGGGRVAARRAGKLLGSGARVHIVSPEVCAETAKLIERGEVRWTPEPYHSRHMDGVTLVIAATDQREVNALVGDDARKRGILVSVADKRQECTFYFPAIVRSDFLTAGLVSNNGDHGMVKQAAARLREEMEAIDADYQSGEPGERSGCCSGAAGHGRDTAVSS